MTTLKYYANEARTPSEILEAQKLRARCFDLSQTVDRDEYDSRARHFVVQEQQSGAVVCCFRLMELQGADLEQSYTAQFYDLSALERYEGPMMELGRFCIDPNHSDPDILRTAWAALTAIVDDTGCQMLFGCSSFEGVEPARHLDALALLKLRHVGPKRWLPRVRASNVFHFNPEFVHKPDLKTAMKGMPPLLRSYLLMGGWVSDHAVMDAALKTLHVFTGLEIGAIPAGRKRLLRALV